MESTSSVVDRKVVGRKVVDRKGSTRSVRTRQDRACRATTAILAVVAVIGPVGVLSGDDRLEATLAELRQVTRAIVENLARQEQAWPTRDQDQKLERPPPLAVRRLELQHSQLLEQKNVLLLRVKLVFDPDGRHAFRHGSESTRAETLASAIRQARSLSFVQAILPIAVEVARTEPEVAGAILELARRSDPCPPSLVNALGDLGSEESAHLLLDIGVRQENVAALVGAGNSGRADTVRRLIQIADRGRGETGRLARATLRRIAPPPGLVHGELESMVAGEIDGVRSTEVKASLLAYLGLFKNPENLGVFQRAFTTSRDDHIRAAALGGMANAGEAGGNALLAAYRQCSTPAMKRSCIHALGSARHRPAVEVLVDALSDTDLRRDAARALRRITGRNLGDRPGPWIRWWRSQGDVPAAWRDPDAR